MGDLLIIIGILAAIATLYHRYKSRKILKNFRKRFTKEELEKLKNSSSSTEQP